MGGYNLELLRRMLVKKDVPETRPVEQDSVLSRANGVY